MTTRDALMCVPPFLIALAYCFVGDIGATFAWNVAAYSFAAWTQERRARLDRDESTIALLQELERRGAFRVVRDEWR